ncbi:WcaI family glycosyltransferase [Pedobacter frigiditerrae]|uniref:WcaI family glycosyltransferase n=1 Tax=Pedobacter frigiditerrae TaxID=2530452 RepID=UPI00292E83E7|nr:WcaI family glycosyltransferase [Pedobacter frigiditerrae]
MSKKILVIGINFFPELTGIGKYTGEMVHWLAEKGYETTMVTSFPYYPYWTVQQPYTGSFYKKEVLKGGKLKVYRCPMYIPKKPTGIRRLLHEASFLISSFFVVFLLLFKKKNELILAVAPPFHLGFLALFYRFFKGGKIVYHIQDLQVDAARELKMLPNGLFSVLFWLERLILKKVNMVSTISEGMIKRVKAKVYREVVFFPNWVNTDSFYPLMNREELKLEWGYKIEEQIILYSGSIGEKQGLDVIVRIADGLRHLPHLKFIICGTGPYKERLIAMAVTANLSNVFFSPLQQSEVFNRFLNMADLHLVLQKGDASDLVMPSKLTTILAVGGLALVTAHESTTLFDVITQNKMGIVIQPENDVSLKQAIEQFSLATYTEQRLRAREYASKYLNKYNILNAFLANF